MMKEKLLSQERTIDIIAEYLGHAAFVLVILGTPLCFIYLTKGFVIPQNWYSEIGFWHGFADGVSAPLTLLFNFSDVNIWNYFRYDILNYTAYDFAFTLGGFYWFWTIETVVKRVRRKTS